MNDPTLPLPGLSSVGSKRVDVRFDGGLLLSDGGVLALREVENRLGVADRLAACLVDPRHGAHALGGGSPYSKRIRECCPPRSLEPRSKRHELWINFTEKIQVCMRRERAVLQTFGHLL